MLKGPVAPNDQPHPYYSSKYFRGNWPLTVVEGIWSWGDNSLAVTPACPLLLLLLLLLIARAVCLQAVWQAGSLAGWRVTQPASLLAASQAMADGRRWRSLPPLLHSEWQDNLAITTNTFFTRSSPPPLPDSVIITGRGQSKVKHHTQWGHSSG